VSSGRQRYPPPQRGASRPAQRRCRGPKAGGRRRQRPRLPPPRRDGARRGRGSGWGGV